MTPARMLVAPPSLLMVGISFAQFIHNPYQSHVGAPFALSSYVPTTFNTSYVGEYQIHVKDWIWNVAPYTMTYKIETVSFPFTPRDEEHTVGTAPW